ncbi:MAG: SIS domain-containing protein [Rhodospirillaceae bacterium]|nr:SIS domain-containing protein [Rhodospirillaceae bacterium]
MSDQTLMAAEAAEAPDVVRRALAANQDLLGALGEELRRQPPSLVLTCARGSSDHAALFGKYLIEQRLRVPVASMAPSVVSVAGAPPRDLRTALVIAVSQSGRSPDVIAAVRACAEAGARVVAIVNDAASPLAEAASLVVPLGAGTERSVAATKTCIASLAVLADLVRHWSDDPELSAALDGLPGRLSAAGALDWAAMVEAFAGAQNLFVISRGAGFGVAHEIALKFKETCAIHAEAFSAAEVEHGPMAIVRNGLPVLMLAAPDQSKPEVIALAARFAARGARVLCAGLDHAAGGVTPLPVAPGAEPLLAPLAWLPSFYPAAARLARARGLDPDRPPFLNKITQTV